MLQGSCLWYGMVWFDMADDGFQALLERIRNRQHPAYGSLIWNGESRQIMETVLFEGNGVTESDEVVRARALRYLEGLTAEERAVANMEIIFRDEKPVRAVLKAQTGELSPDRLAELRKRAGL